MNQFQQMIQDIIKRYKDRLSYSSVPEYRVQYINNMRDELMAMKEVWEVLHPNEDTTVPSFEEVVKQLA